MIEANSWNKDEIKLCSRKEVKYMWKGLQKGGSSADLTSFLFGYHFESPIAIQSSGSVGIEKIKGLIYLFRIMLSIYFLRCCQYILKLLLIKLIENFLKENW